MNMKYVVFLLLLICLSVKLEATSNITNTTSNELFIDNEEKPENKTILLLTNAPKPEVQHYKEEENGDDVEEGSTNLSDFSFNETIIEKVPRIIIPTIEKETEPEILKIDLTKIIIPDDNNSFGLPKVEPPEDIHENTSNVSQNDSSIVLKENVENATGTVDLGGLEGGSDNPEEIDQDIPAVQKVPVPVPEETETKPDVKETAVPETVSFWCRLPKITPNCWFSHPKYFYDSKSKSCKYFYYIESTFIGFETWEECAENCSRNNDKKQLTSAIDEKDYFIQFVGKGAVYYDLSELTDINFLEVYFRIRTTQLDADLVSIVSVSAEIPDVQIFLQIQNGKFTVELIHGMERESYALSEGGIQEEAWISLRTSFNRTNGKILLHQNEKKIDFDSEILQKLSNYSDKRIYIAGIPNGHLHKEIRHRSIAYIGYLTDFQISTNNSDVESLGLNAILNNATLVDSVRVSNFNDKYTDINRCKSNAIDLGGKQPKILSLTGGDYLRYPMYGTKYSNLQSYISTFSLTFKTQLADQILLYAYGGSENEFGKEQFLSLILDAKNQLYLEVNLGGETITSQLFGNFSDNYWHDVKIVQQYNIISIAVDDQIKEIEVYSEDQTDFFYLNPFLYIGGIPGLGKDCSLRYDEGNMNGTECNKNLVRYFYDVDQGNCQNFTYKGCGGNLNNFENTLSCLSKCPKPGLRSHNFFNGCMKDIYYDKDDILQEVVSNLEIYHGTSKNVPLSNDCNLEQIVLPSVSFTTEESYMKLQRKREALVFNLEMEFNLKHDIGVLASGYVHILESNYQWELYYEPSGQVGFIIPIDFANVKVVAKNTGWQKIKVRSEGQMITLNTADQESSVAVEAPLFFAKDILFGVGNTGRVSGFVGCMQNILVDNELIDVRNFVGSSLSSQDVVMDGCQVLHPCDWVNSCPPSAECSVVNHISKCSCEESPFEGPDCNFPKYRKSCSEYNKQGYEKNGTYVIDMNGNGKIAYVNCEFANEDQIMTVIDHNVPEKFTIRQPSFESFTMNISYREFDDRMLREITDRSKSCYQKIKFSCSDSPLSLAKNSYFSSPRQSKIGSISHDQADGSCPCKDDNSCQDLSVKCNCDINDGLIHEDEATLRNLKYIPVTSLTAVQNSNLGEFSKINLDLGSLVCKEFTTKYQSISFLSSESFLTIPSWYRGNFFFKFRTTSERGNIFYQKCTVNDMNMKITLVSNNQLQLNVSFGTMENSVTIKTPNPLNTGKWNSIWIDESQNTLRFVMNNQKKFLKLPSGMELNHFRNEAIFGYLADSKNVSFSGIIGCIKDLMTNDENLEVSKLLQFSNQRDVNIGCESGCEMQPCKNGGKCIEKWSSYECICENPYAHSGTDCEQNLNENAISFSSSTSEVVYFNSSDVKSEWNPLRHNITFNIRTTQTEAMIFLAKDHIQNLVQIYLKNPYQVVLLVNFGKELLNVTVDTEDNALNEGQSVQIMVDRLRNETTLSVFTRTKLFTSSVNRTVQLMVQLNYEQFPYEMFIGGVQSSGISSDLPGLIGCFRGLKILDKVLEYDPLADNWKFGQGIERGCASFCEGNNNPCKHGGVCINDFLKDTDHHCNCDNTPYIGKTCSQEVSYHFNGRDSIGEKVYKLPFENEFHIKFSFTPEQENDLKNEQLLLKTTMNMLSKENNDTNTLMGLSFLLSQHQSLILVVEEKENVRKLTDIPLNRKIVQHIVNIRYKEEQITYLIDSVLVSNVTTLNGTYEEPLVSDYDLLIGGVENDQKLDFNFKGCISNVLLKSDHKEYKPLELYKAGKDFEAKGLPKYGNCEVVHTINAQPVFYEYSNAPIWAVAEPLKIPVNISWTEPTVQADRRGPVVPDTTRTVFVTTPRPTTTTRAPKTAKIWPWALMACLGSFMLLILVVCCLRKCKKKPVLKYDVETTRTVVQEPPPYSLQPPQRVESIPLLEREPSVRFKLPPKSDPDEEVKENGNHHEEEAKEPNPSPEIVAAKTHKNNRPVIHLNSIDRETNVHVPFVNQLSKDSNKLRFIDGSSTESLQNRASYYKNSLQDDKDLLKFQQIVKRLQNNSEEKGNLRDEPVLVTNMDEDLERVDDAETKRKVFRKASKDSKDYAIPPSPVPTVNPDQKFQYPPQSSKPKIYKNKNRESHDYAIPPSPVLSRSHKTAKTDTESNPSTRKSKKPSRKYSADKKQDMKTYYLKRKASQPPALPPREK